MSLTIKSSVPFFFCLFFFFCIELKLLSHYFISSYDIPVMAAVVVMKKDATYLECQID